MSEDSNNENNNGTKSTFLRSFLETHGKPVTRREMLASGAIPFAATAVMPTWLTAFANAGLAQAQDLVCSQVGQGEMPAFVQIKLNGGWSSSYNHLPTDQGGQLINMTRIGGGLAGNIPTSVAFANNALFYQQSGFLAGVTTQALPTTLARSVFVSILASSQDDSSNNAQGITGIIDRLGLKGNYLPKLGSNATITGIAAVPAVIPPSEGPLRVTRYEDILGALGVTGVLAALSNEQKASLFNTVQNLTAQQTLELAGFSGGQTLSRLLQCANISNSNLVGNTNGLNTSPLTNATFATEWGINANTATNNQNFVFASMVWNACNGNAGAISLDMGGYDYHGNPKTTTDARDNAAGVLVGRILDSFAITNKAGIIVLNTDGSVSSAESQTPGAPFVSDRGASSSIYVIAYHPTKLVTASASQIGYLNSGQAADGPLGSNIEKASAVAALQVASFAGKVAEWEMATNRMFTTTEIDSYKKITAA